MVRKSKKIGKVINGFLILDSESRKTGTWFKVKCTKCGHIQYKSFNFVKITNVQCDKCNVLRKKRNANGHYGEPIYNRYIEIIRRTEQHEYYKNKNITMCEEWQNDFMKFYEWAINNGYRDDLTIDRIDNTKGYSPDNCRWATSKEQANNRTNNVVVEYNGKKLTLSQLAEKYNLPKYIVYNRYKAKWDIEDIVNRPIDISKRNKKYGK